MDIKLDERQIPQGPLVLAVSGGVDSVVLLDLMAKEVPAKRLIIAHVNHGMRPEAAGDQRFVAELARSYGLEFRTATYRLKGKSEAVARQKRYAFLASVAKEVQAETIVTAHHRDDILETMIINTWRGTRGRGLIALRNRAGVYRPLLAFNKQQIYRYAADHCLEYVEDASNRQLNYLRNRVRRWALPKLRILDATAETALMAHYATLRSTYALIDEDLAFLSSYLGSFYASVLRIPRQRFINLPSDIRREWLVYVLDRKGIERSQLNSASLRRIEEFTCTAKPGRTHLPQRSLRLISHESEVSLRFKGSRRSGIRSLS